MMFTRHAPLIVLMALVLLAGTYATAATLSVPGSYSTIQTAINGATTGDVVVVSPGTYHERINFNGRAITVRSTAPTNPAVVAATIINGGAGGSVVTFKAHETAAALLSGFTITNGSGTDLDGGKVGGGIYCYGSSPTISYNVITGNTAIHGGGMKCDAGSPAITNNTIEGNRASHGGGMHLGYCSSIISGNVIRSNEAIGSSLPNNGGAIDCDHSSPTIVNNVIANNASNTHGGGICCYASSPAVVNNTFTGNHCAGSGGNIFYEGSSNPALRNCIVTNAIGGGGIVTDGSYRSVAYCDVYGNTGGNYVGMTDQTGSNGNLSVDPLFANAAGGDFHEKSMAGRWNGSGWVGDPVTSPCVDAGDPASSYANEPAPNGSRVNMGAYGNTAYASKSGSAASPPTVVCATFVDNNHVNLLFTKALNAGTVGAVGNYSVTPSLGVTAATLDADTKTVHLTTAAQTLSTTYTVTVKGVKDTLGNAIVAGSGDAASWTPSAIVPTVIATLPTGTKVGAEKVNITTAFSTPMNKASAESALSITPVQASGVAHGWPGTFVWVGNQMQYKLTTALAPLTTYKVTIDTTAQSSGGARLGSTKTWSFTTTAAPAVASYSPTGTGAAAERPTITATFNTTMNKATAQGAFSISPAQAVGVARGWPGAFSWVGNKLQYKLSTSLKPNTTYTVKITKAAKSSAGVAMAADKTWTFKTNGQPAVMSYAPTGTAVPRSTSGKVIRIVFNQAMNKASVQGALWVNRKGAAPSATPTRPPGVFSWVGNEMRYTLTNKLSALTYYTVKLGTGAKSWSGVARTTEFKWSFTTGGLTTSPSAVTVASASTATGAQITLNLSAAAHVTVSIRNLAGREVAVLTPGELAAGVQTLLWNAKSRMGTRVPAGVYLLQVKANGADGASAQALTSLQLR